MEPSLKEFNGGGGTWSDLCFQTHTVVFAEIVYMWAKLESQLPGKQLFNDTLKIWWLLEGTIWNGDGK